MLPPLQPDYAITRWGREQVKLRTLRRSTSVSQILVGAVVDDCDSADPAAGSLNLAAAMASPAAPNEPVTPTSKLHLAATTAAGGAAPLATPVVDMATIEAAKENIVPLNSGRSASQLAALSSSTRSGLGVKLDLEHARFQAQIRAVDEYERNGAWPDGQDGLASEDVALLAEDPLDASHQYVRFVVANYPAVASAANKLVPVLEATTRKFLGDERYSNDPRYFRLWAHYAKNMEDPEDCYRFLFVKGVGEKLAALYEEYAKVLEAKNKCARRRQSP